jgi:uncharacterized protein (TIGR03435 family)
LPLPGKVPCGEILSFPPGHLTGLKAPVKQLVIYLSEITGRAVLDNTNLSGKYDISLAWTPQYRLDAIPRLDHTEPNNPSLLTAIHEQLGLKLEPQTSPVDLLVIDHAQKPSEN